ncbi:hypothetical protein HNR39_001990 [Glaciimonas immobilis]|uniref:Uncharacterized protein n=1 Tax=Glaciimonas immobilis TaxID=728004 RepID=A0A840RQW3_9BURK|nr:hypothetical protein [Glaciimonas immobilis]
MIVGPALRTRKSLQKVLQRGTFDFDRVVMRNQVAKTSKS